MQTTVIRYEHQDFEVIVRTQDIRYSWNKFKGRINYARRTNSDIAAPEKYCRYTSSDDCILHLYNPETQETVQLKEGKTWDNQCPVVFETCKYQIRLLFHGVDPTAEPEVRHVRKDVEDSFFYDEETKDKGEKSLTGELDFLNEPGLLKLEFAYQKEGKRKDAFVTFEIVSPKLDTKNDYKSLLREVNEEYENVIYRYLSISLQQFCRGRLNTDATWMTAFQSVVDDYLKNIHRVIQNPHSQIEEVQASRKAEQIKQWTPNLEEQYGEVSSAGKSEEYYFSYKEAHSTHDTRENRFVKHTIETIGKRLSSIISTVLGNTQEGLSERHRQQWIDYHNALKKLQKHPFFRSVGRFDGMKQESLVLQSRMGYRQIYKDWLKLKRGIDIYNGAVTIGTLQIWEIYELWCFIKMKKLVADVLGISREDALYEQLVTEPKGTLLNPFSNSSLEHIVEYRYPSAGDNLTDKQKARLLAHKDDVVTLHYQHTFNRRSGRSGYDMGMNTATTEQRPDIVLNIRNSSGEYVLTYLYDAKYRVINDKVLDRDFEEQDAEEYGNMPGGDYPPTDAINQMHRYRDAIYYSKEHEPYRSKEIIGGYILFPGRGDDESIKRRYYSTSIESINIGAFPLLPNNDSLLREHLENILLNYSSSEMHVANAKPQRTLAYVTEDEKSSIMNEDLVMVAVAGSPEKRQWSFDKQWYNIPLDQIADSPWMKAKYLLLYIKGEQSVGNLCRIVRSRHDVWTAEKLMDTDYPDTPHSKSYFMIRIHKPDAIDDSLRAKSFNIKDISVLYWGNRNRPFFLVKLKDLLMG
ncbi:MAG: DUF2357 domain-containing protein [Bacteroidales bacterium]|nr:DUF2357 domain-containing protein [Bacteroidales bacterium]